VVNFRLISKFSCAIYALLFFPVCLMQISVKRQLFFLQRYQQFNRSLMQTNFILYSTQHIELKLRPPQAKGFIPQIIQYPIVQRLLSNSDETRVTAVVFRDFVVVHITALNIFYVETNASSVKFASFVKNVFEMLFLYHHNYLFREKSDVRSSKLRLVKLSNMICFIKIFVLSG